MSSKSTATENGPEQEREVPKTAYIHPHDKKELQKVLVTYPSYKNLPHLLENYLSRSLIPRIEKGTYFPGRLLAAVTGPIANSDGSNSESTGSDSPNSEGSRSESREKVQFGRAYWEQVKDTASVLTGHVRRLEERVAWSGSLQTVPFCRCGPELIVRAGARELAVWSRGGPTELFSREEVSKEGGSGWQRPGEGGRSEGRMTPDDSGRSQEGGPREGRPGEGVSRGEGGGSGSGESLSGNSSGRRPADQGMRKLPGQDRGGKPVQFAITEDAKDTLKEKAGRISQDGTHLLRRATLWMLEWVEEAPRRVPNGKSSNGKSCRRPPDWRLRRMMRTCGPHFRE